MLEFLQREHLPLPERAVCRANYGQLVLHIGLAKEVGGVNSTFNQGDIQFVAENFSFQLLRGGHQHLHLDTGILCGEVLDVCWQKLRADGDTGTHSQETQGIPGAHMLLHIRKGCDDGQGVFPQLRTGLRRLKAAAHTFKQPHAIVLLQFLDGQTNRRLSHKQGLRSLGGIALVVPHRQENFHVPQCHHRFAPCYLYKNTYGNN